MAELRDGLEAGPGSLARTMRTSFQLFTASPRFLFVCLYIIGASAKGDQLHRPHRRHSGVYETSRWHRKARPLLAMEGLVFVYDLPARFNNESLQLPLPWHSEQYDFDVKVHEHLLASPLRTTNPAEAKLFYMPVYLARQMNWFWQRTDIEVRNFWTDAWLAAQNHSSHVLLDAINYVKHNFPYWDRHSGKDHFTAFSFDHGRCDLAAFLTAEELGGLFAIQSFGDLSARSDGSPSWARDMSENYTWPGPVSWACVRPDMDIIVPMYIPYNRADLIPPFKGPRPVSALLRFDVKFGDGKNLMVIHGHRLRHELLQLWSNRGLADSAVGPKSVKETEHDMAHSIFCVCPPGNTQDTTRVWRALAHGCIPVTFFRATELPFARFLGLDYRRFMVNIQPDDYEETPGRLARILQEPKLLRSLQQGVLEYQGRFLWDSAGVFSSLDAELAFRAANLEVPTSVFV